METFPDKKNIKNDFVDSLAENLHNDFHNSVLSGISPDEAVNEFQDLSKEEKSFWLEFARKILKNLAN